MRNILIPVDMPSTQDDIDEYITELRQSALPGKEVRILTGIVHRIYSGDAVAICGMVTGRGDNHVEGFLSIIIDDTHEVLVPATEHTLATFA